MCTHVYICAHICVRTILRPKICKYVYYRCRQNCNQRDPNSNFGERWDTESFRDAERQLARRFSSLYSFSENYRSCKTTYFESSFWGDVSALSLNEHVHPAWVKSSLRCDLWLTRPSNRLRSTIFCVAHKVDPVKTLFVSSRQTD